VMVLALVMAVAMILFAWRVLRRDRSRTEARVSQLRAMAQEPDPEWSDSEEFPELTYQAGYQPAPLFDAGPAPTRVRWGTLVLVVMVFMGIGAGTVYALYGRDFPVAWPFRIAEASAGNSNVPLELLSLTHRREPNGDFVVTGLVQNPVTGHATPALVAVAYLFDSDEQYFASGTAAMDVAALAPGDQSPFTIRLSNVGAVRRYRLGFRLGDGGVFAHVDRRGAPMVGTTAAIVEEAR
jgi:hypothetical protein